MSKRPTGNNINVVSEILNTNIENTEQNNIKSVKRLVTWDYEFYNQVEACAKKKRMSVSAFIRQCVAEKVEEMNI